MGGLKFTKMQAAGNDYIYFNCLQETIPNPGELARILCRRHTGIGADGIVLILAAANTGSPPCSLPAPATPADFRMRMFNADGSEAGMCGNAIRCVGKYLYNNGLTAKQRLTIETMSGIRQLRLITGKNRPVLVEVDLGLPVWEAERIPVQAITGSIVIGQEIPVGQRTFNVTCLSVGNPHCIIFTDTLDDELVHCFGAKIETHRFFPERTNVEFVKVIDRHEVAARVWERGTGETLACGTGAGAICAAACRLGYTGRVVTCHMPGGDLQVRLARDSTVTLAGPAETVYSGEIQEAELLRMRLMYASSNPAKRLSDS